MTLLERDWLLDSLSGLAVLAAAGSGSIAFLSGDAGAGKTAVVRASLKRLPERTAVLIGACDPMPTPGQLWPLRDLAESASPVLREPVLAGSDREALFRAALAELSAHPGATVMVIEDAHWADDATLDLIRFLGRRVANTRGLVIVTYRDDNSAQARRLRLVLGDLATTGATHRFAVPPLSRAAVDLLASHRAIDLDALYARTGGNPFFVTEMLAGGTLLPDTVSDAISARYANLSAPAREIIELAAVLGRPIDMPTLRTIAGDSSHALIEAIESGALQFDGRMVQFRHELVRDAVSDSIEPIQRVQIANRIFSALESGAGDTDPATMAHFAELAGRFDVVPVYAKTAAQRATQLRSYREAAIQYHRAIRYSAGWTLAERSELIGQLASATYYCGNGEADLDVLREMVQTCRVAGDTPRLIDHLLSLSWLLNDEGMLPESEQCAIEAMELSDELGDPALRAAAMCALADIHFQSGRLSESLALDTVALELAMQSGRGRIAVHAGITMGSALLAIDEPAGIALLEECVDSARRQHFDGEVAHALGILGFHFTDSYALGRGQAVLEEMAKFTSEHDLDCWWRWATIGRTRNALARGDWEAATSHVAAALRVQSGCFLNRLQGYLALASIRARRGDPEVSEAIEAAVISAGDASFPSIDCSIALGKAEAALLAGDAHTACQAAMPALESAVDNNLPWLAGQLAHIVSRAGGTPPLSYQPVGPFRAELEGNWEGAACEWEALGAPYEAACALAMLNDEHSLRKARSSFDRLGARPMSALVTRRLREIGVTAISRGPRRATKAHPLGLTPREAEVLELVGDGYTNLEIAARLFLSERTVEHHVSAVLNKLGVTSRRDAVRLARSSRAPVPARELVSS